MKPIKIPIGLVTYTVKFRKHVKLKNGEVFGFCDFKAKVIEISTDTTKDVLLMTFLHECIHAIYHELGYVVSAQNEPLVESMSQNIARAMRALPDDLR